MTNTDRSPRAAWRVVSDTRLHWLRFCVLGSFLALTAALMLFQVLWADRYVGLALKNRLRIVRLPPARGQIYDRNGMPLALNVMTFDIAGYPLDLRKSDLKQKFLAALERVHLPHDAAALDARIRRLTVAPYRAISLVTGLTTLQMTSLMEDPEFPSELFPMPVWQRTYPAGKLAAHVVGYVGEISERELSETDPAAENAYAGGDVVGKGGIEKYYEERLRGSVGELALEVDARGRRRRALDEKSPGIGADLTLTIDLGAQRFAASLLEGYKGAMVVIDVRNGEVVTLWSNPSYDPNPLSWGISAAEWAALNLAPDRPMLNRVINGRYSPGSIFKAVTGYAALDSGVVNRNTPIQCRGTFSLSGRVYRCWQHAGHGRETFVRALRDSCDVYFYETSQNVGIKKYDEVSHLFGLGSPLGIDLPGESGGILPSPEWKRSALKQGWYRGDSVNMSIGQGYLLMTPLQMCSVYATIAADGTFYRPHLLKSENVKGRTTGLKPEHLRLVQESLRAVVAAGGTGYHAVVNNLDLAGKTGTVQNSHGKDHAVFAGYAPASKPRYASVCFIEGGESGGRVAGPLVGQMLDWLLRHDGGE